MADKGQLNRPSSIKTEIQITTILLFLKYYSDHEPIAAL